MKRVSFVLAYNKRLIASCEFNGGVDTVKAIKAMQDVVDLTTFESALQKVLNDICGKRDYYELIMSSMTIPESLEVVFDCPPGVGDLVEQITSDLIFVLNQSEKGLRIHRYVGDYIDVDVNEMLVFDGTVESIVVVMH